MNFQIEFLHAKGVIHNKNYGIDAYLGVCILSIAEKTSLEIRPRVRVISRVKHRLALF